MSRAFLTGMDFFFNSRGSFLLKFLSYFPNMIKSKTTRTSSINAPSNVKMCLFHFKLCLAPLFCIKVYLPLCSISKYTLPLCSVYQSIACPSVPYQGIPCPLCFWRKLYAVLADGEGGNSGLFQVPVLLFEESFALWFMDISFQHLLPLLPYCVVMEPYFELFFSFSLFLFFFFLF